MVDYAFPTTDPSSPTSLDIPVAVPANGTHIGISQRLTFTGYRYSMMYIIDPTGTTIQQSAGCQDQAYYARPKIDQTMACQVDVYGQENGTMPLTPGAWTIRLQWNELNPYVAPEASEAGSVSWMVDNSSDPHAI